MEMVILPFPVCGVEVFEFVAGEVSRYPPPTPLRHAHVTAGEERGGNLLWVAYSGVAIAPGKATWHDCSPVARN